VILADRLAAFQRAFPQWPASWPWLTEEQGHPTAYAVWVIGPNYRNPTRFYGAYPNSYLDRVLALFPDVAPQAMLHVFSGSLPAGAYTRCDLVQPAELQCSVYDLPRRTRARFRLTLADPPYTPADAARYGTPSIDRRRALAALAAVTRPGGFCAWLDTCWPMHAKSQWVTVGRILLQRSTNHRARVCTLFERVA
jgi:hypothetical protein